MDHFAGLDVSVKETSLCIVDDAPTPGTVIRRRHTASCNFAKLPELLGKE